MIWRPTRQKRWSCFRRRCSPPPDSRPPGIVWRKKKEHEGHRHRLSRCPPDPPRPSPPTYKQGRFRGVPAMARCRVRGTGDHSSAVGRTRPRQSPPSTRNTGLSRLSRTGGESKMKTSPFNLASGGWVSGWVLPHQYWPD